ncbi:hypothetical protein WN943_007042 [Citrus x changshan-huyou]
MGHSNSLPNVQLINQNNEAQHYAIVSLIEETCQISYNNHVAGARVKLNNSNYLSRGFKSCQHEVTNEDLTFLLLVGLGPGYDSVVVNITTRVETSTLQEVYLHVAELGKCHQATIKVGITQREA